MPLAAGLIMVAWVLALGEPGRGPEATPPPVAVPPWSGPPTVDTPGVLADGANYTPRLYLDPQTSVGVATAADGAARIIVARASGGFTELRSRPGQDRMQVSGFAADGDTLVWMETTARQSGGSVTTLWRTSLAGQTPPVQVTTNVGETSFYGQSAEVLIVDGRIQWTSLVTGEPPRTEVRSVAITGGQVSTRRIDGEFLLSTTPWAVSVPAGPGSPVTLLNLTSDERLTVTTATDEAAVCDPVWCRVSVTGESGLIGVDVMRPDGSDRQRVADSKVTPVIGAATLLGRYLPLAIDRADGVGLTLYDLTTGTSQLIAPRAGNVAGRGGILWWSTGVGSELTWHALDLSRLP